MLAISAIWHHHSLIAQNNLRYTPGSYRTYDYLLTDEQDFTMFIIILGAYLVTVKYLYDNRMSTRHKVFSLSFGVLAILCALDMTIGSWGMPGHCGNDFTLGNCFMADGLSEIAYYYLVPISMIISIGILLHGRKSVKPKGKR